MKRIAKLTGWLVIAGIAFIYYQVIKDGLRILKDSAKEDRRRYESELE